MHINNWKIKISELTDGTSIDDICTIVDIDNLVICMTLILPYNCCFT